MTSLRGYPQASRWQAIVSCSCNSAPIWWRTRYVIPRGGRGSKSTCIRSYPIVLAVSDGGQGIPESERGKVFRRFYRLEASRTTPGSGLGLALVAAVVELHDGRISLSDNQPGLKVTIVLPL